MLLENLMVVGLIMGVEIGRFGGLAKCGGLSRCIRLLIRRMLGLRSFGES